MVKESVQIAVRKYLEAARAAGFHVRQAVLFGSHARGEGREDSDIDLIIIAPELDNLADRRLISKLWELRAFTDSRIEPIPCGEKEWDRDWDRPILEIARREGIIITEESLMQ
jgi:predicted nucleotidyltransferase